MCVCVSCYSILISNLRSPPFVTLAGFVKLNAEQQVPMRVCYDEEMVKRLVVGIKGKLMSASDRAGVLADAYALVKAGMMEPGQLIRLLKAYEEEDDATVWEALEGVLGGLNKATAENDLINGGVKKIGREIIGKLVAKVGWDAREEDGHLDKLLRGTMVRLLSVFCYDEEGVKKEAEWR